MITVRLLHILLSVWFVGGLLGRWAAYAQARRASDIRVAAALLGLSDRFERLMVIPGSQAALLLGLATAWLQGRPLLGAPGAVWLPVSLALSVALIPLVALVLAPRRRRRLALIAAAVEAGALTPELRAALDDRAVLAARAAELAVVATVLVLMILKPF